MLVKIDQPEQAMKQRTTQRVIQLFRRKAGRALLLALLLTQPAWALRLCFCQPSSEPQHECCEVNQSTTLATKSAVAHHCAEAETPAEQNQFKDHPQTTARCCDLTTRFETVATIDTPQHQESVVTTTSYLPGAASTIEVVAHFDHQSPPQTRPLYLTYSCLLI
jgi:hypothetical protein